MMMLFCADTTYGAPWKFSANPPKKNKKDSSSVQQPIDDLIDNTIDNFIVAYAYSLINEEANDNKKKSRYYYLARSRSI